MDSEHGRERQMMCSYVNRDECSWPIMNVQDLRRRCQTARQFHRRFAEKNKARGVIFISGAVLTVNSVAIEKLVTKVEEQLHTTRDVAFQVFTDVNRIADANIDRVPTV